ncbi:MAG: biotin transporter BioY [Pseudomonadota bacterium]
MERSVALIAVFAALMAASGYLPALSLAAGIPITAQTLVLMLAGTVVGAVRGGLAMLLFVGVGALGLPVFAGGKGGLGVFAGPTMGFIIGFPVAAFVTGFVMAQLRRTPVVLAAGVSAVLGGIVVLYVFGIFGFMMITGKDLAFSATTMAVFIPGDLVKAVLAAVITAALARARPASILSRA